MVLIEKNCLMNVGTSSSPSQAQTRSVTASVLTEAAAMLTRSASVPSVTWAATVAQARITVPVLPGTRHSPTLSF